MKKNQINPSSIHSAVWLSSLLVIVVALVSCGGCSGGKAMTHKIENSKDTSQHDVKTNNNSRAQPSSEQKYPYTSGSKIYLNDSTIIIDGITFVEKDGKEKIIFPNKKVIEKSDYPIIRDFPSNYDLKPNENYGYYDLTKMSVKKKRELFANMDGYNPDKVKNYIQAELSCRTYGLTDTTSDRVYIVTDMLIIEEEKRSEHDIFWYSVGRIGRMEIYDKKGNKLQEIKLDKFGCSGLCITPDKKHIIINSTGDDDSGNFHVIHNAAITIWSYENPKLIDNVIIDPNYLAGEGYWSNNRFFFNAKEKNGDNVLVLNIFPDKKLVRTAVLSIQEYLNAKGDFDLRDEGKLSKNKINSFTFQEWNNLVISKRTTLNEAE